MSKSNPEDSRILELFLNSPNKRNGWAEHFSYILYTNGPASPASILEKQLINSIEPKGASLEDRINDFRRTIREERILDQSNPKQSIFIRSSQDKVTPITKALTTIDDFLTAESPNSHLRKEVLKEIKDLYTKYGTAHSIYHFIEFITIALTLIITDDKLDSRRIPAAFEKRLQEYGSGDDSLLFLLPFTNKPNKLVGNQTPDSVLQAKLQKMSKNSLVLSSLWMCDKSSWIADGILVLRDMIVCATSTLSMKKSKLKATYLSSLIEGEYSKVTGIQIYLKNLAELLSRPDIVEQLGIPLKFDELTLFDTVASKGRLREHFDRLVKLYNEKVEELCSIMKVRQIPRKSFIQLKKDDLLTIEKDEFFKALCTKQITSDTNDERFCRILKNELYDRLACSFSVDQNPELIKFSYTDAYMEDVMAMFQRAELQGMMVHQVSAISKEVFKPLVKIEVSANLIILEKDLLYKLKKALNSGFKAEDDINLEFEITVKFKHLEAFYKVLLLKKLAMRLMLKTNLRVRDYPKHNLIMEALKSSLDKSIQTPLLNILIQTAGGQYIDSMFKDCLKEGCDKDLNGDVLLQSLEDLAPMLEGLYKKHRDLQGLMVGDLLSSGDMMCKELAK